MLRLNQLLAALLYEDRKEERGEEEKDGKKGRRKEKIEDNFSKETVFLLLSLGFPKTLIVHPKSSWYILKKEACWKISRYSQIWKSV